MDKKYIDAEKLIAEIERRREICADIAADERNEEVAEYYRGKEVAHDEISSFVTSLQQEQPGLPGIEENGIPGKDYIPVEWVDACERYGKWKIVKQEQPATYDEAYLNEKIAKATKSWEGVDVDKFMDEVRGREPEVDLEKEYTEFVVSDPVYSKLVNGIVGKSIAQHIFELGQSIQYQKDRLEFSKLKVREWKEGFDAGYEKGLNEQEITMNKEKMTKTRKLL